MRPVAMLTITGLIALVVAVLTGSTPLAVIVVALAMAGIVLLVRDWRAERRGRSAARVSPVQDPPAQDEPGASRRISPDDFSPDISTDPNGPSSDARAD